MIYRLWLARATSASGDQVAPHYHGKIWMGYPPMLYWVGSILSQLLRGKSEFVPRLPFALAAMGLVVITCAVGS